MRTGSRLISHMLRSRAVLLLSLFAGAASAQAPQPPAPRATIVAALSSVREDLSVEGDQLAGPGAATLLKAVEQSRLIGIGEDHVTVEIPQFVAALCSVERAELTGLVLEVGPRALSVVRPYLNRSDRAARMAAFNSRYPSGIAFLDNADDNAMAARCLADEPKLKLIGIDQEFLGSAGLLLDLILAEKLKPAALAKVLALRGAERAANRKALKTGDPADALLLSAKQEDLDAVAAALKSGGSKKAQTIFSELQESRRIYLEKGNASNQDRALLLKANLRAQLPGFGKVLIKMGDWHIYRGYNPLNNRDVGNWIAERADQEGKPSLHILILGEQGVHAMYSGYNRPLSMQPFRMVNDPDYAWLGALVAARGFARPGSWDLFDLRKLRDLRLSGVDVQWRRVLDGFDLLILVPVLTPSDRIGALPAH